jgi:hypothetical protein
VQTDALDPARGVVVLMPKPGDANEALSVADPSLNPSPYLDAERPEFGISR